MGYVNSVEIIDLYVFVKITMLERLATSIVYLVHTIHVLTMQLAMIIVPGYYLQHQILPLLMVIFVNAKSTIMEQTVNIK